MKIAKLQILTTHVKMGWIKKRFTIAAINVSTKNTKFANQT
jgi:hypothetical protein